MILGKEVVITEVSKQVLIQATKDLWVKLQVMFVIINVSFLVP